MSEREITVSVLDSNLKIIAQNNVNNVSLINHLFINGKLYLRQMKSPEDKLNFIGFKLVPVPEPSNTPQ